MGIAFVALVCATACSVLIEGQLSSRDAGREDRPPIGPACTTTEQCLMLAGSQFDCAQLCVGGHCVHQAGMHTPDGTSCGTMGLNVQICVFNSAMNRPECVMRRCGDTYVDRHTPGSLEYCDDGANGIDTDGCTDLCTRTCGVGTPVCSGSAHDPCNGDEQCGPAMTCEVQSPALMDGANCTISRAIEPPPDGGPTTEMVNGTCHNQVCIVP